VFLFRVVDSIASVESEYIYSEDIAMYIYY